MFQRERPGIVESARDNGPSRAQNFWGTVSLSIVTVWCRDVPDTYWVSPESLPSLRSVVVDFLGYGRSSVSVVGRERGMCRTLEGPT